MVSLALVLGLVHILSQRIFHSTGTIRREPRICYRGQYHKAHKLENCKVFVRPFHGARMRCLEDHVKSVLRKNPDEIIFHIRTNDLPSGEGSKNIAETLLIWRCL